MKIFLIGFMGSGKTFLGKQLSQKLSIPFFDLDEQIESHENKKITEIFEKDGEEYFRLLEKDTLHIITESHDSFVMATGGGTSCYFNNIDYIKSSGTVIWINTPIHVLFERLLKEKDTRPLIRNLEDDQIRGFIIKKFADRKIFYEQAHLSIEDEAISLEEIVDKIFHA